MLDKTSRSFAAVIQALGEELRDAVALFYLTLRALDTFEDDTSFPLDKKLPILATLHTKLYQKGWNYVGCGENENERQLLAHFDRCINCFLSIDSKFQKVIEEITRRMGKGMTEFIEREVVTEEDWDLYCHYVAGLVGIGLSKLFAASNLEDPSFATMDKLSNSMGLFLQKTNIIRDYLEDINQKRIFWPRAVWSKYAKRLEDFKEAQYSKEAVHCLNDLVTNAMNHLPDCLDYMSRLKDKHVFNFCAIPQIMAMATLSLCYANHDIFTSVVKMKRELTEEIILSMNGMQSVYYWYNKFIGDFVSKLDPKDPNYYRLRTILTEAKQYIDNKAPNLSHPKSNL
jgi:farnesyl-diphosphate farnesyltransferase